MINTIILERFLTDGKPASVAMKCMGSPWYLDEGATAQDAIDTIAGILGSDSASLTARLTIQVEDILLEVGALRTRGGMWEAKIHGSAWRPLTLSDDERYEVALEVAKICDTLAVLTP